MQKETTLNFINYYCERGAERNFFAEPINFLTNFCFIIAAFLIFKLLKTSGSLNKKNSDIIILATVFATIGIGSGAFHSIPNQATLLLDVIPIAIFIHLYITVFFVRIIGLKIWQAIIVLSIFIGAGILSENTFDPDTLNGTIMYVPTYAMLLFMSSLIFLTKKQGAKYLLITTFIWTFSLIFRTFDEQWCSQTQHLGTHFMWHILNSVVLYRCLKLLILNKPSSSISSPVQLPH